MKHWWILFLLSCCVWQTKAVGIDTLTVYSPSMRKNVDALVLCPAGYSPTKNIRWFTCYMDIAMLGITVG